MGRCDTELAEIDLEMEMKELILLHRIAPLANDKMEKTKQRTWMNRQRHGRMVRRTHIQQHTY